MKKLLIAATCSVLLFSCKKKDDRTTTTQMLKYKQTYCADKWTTGPHDNDAQTLADLRAYLTAQGLYHTQETIAAENPPSLCNACSCETGKIIYVRTAVTQQQQYFNLGFTR